MWVAFGVSRKLQHLSFDRVLLPCLLALVCLRAWVFIAFPHSHFDSDQAVFGLMAKDIAAGRAYPLFMYGQRYMVPIGAWLCAPLLGVLGTSVFTLKLPMLVMNLTIAALLWLSLRREPGVGPYGAAVATLPFALPAVATASRLVEHAGGNIEPFLFVLLGYLARNRAILAGVVFGIGFLNREFALIGFIALIALDVVHGRIRLRYKAHLTTAAVILVISVVIRKLAELSPDYYGAETHLSLRGLRSWQGLLGYFEVQLPTLIGGYPRKLGAYNIASQLSVGHGWLYWTFAVWFVAIVVLRLRRIRLSELDNLPTYLILVGAGQAAAYIVICPAPFDVMLLRYALLSFYALVGLIALAWSDIGTRYLTLGFTALMFASNLYDHSRLISEYIERRPRHDNEVLANALLREGAGFGVGDYWVTYDISFLTDERIILSPFPGQMARMRRYREAVEQHRDQAMIIDTAPCAGGTRVLKWYLCPASSTH